MKQSLYEPQHEILIQVLSIVKKPQEAFHLALTLHLIWVIYRTYIHCILEQVGD